MPEAKQLTIDFTQSMSVRMRRAQQIAAADAIQPQLFVAPPNLDVHLHSPAEAVAHISGSDPDRTLLWLQGIVGSVRIIKSKRLAFPTAALDRLLSVCPPANVTLDGAAKAVALSLWAHELGFKPLRVVRERQRLLAYSPRWPAGFRTKDVPWTAIATLHHLGIPLDVDERARCLMTTKLGASGAHIATAGLAGSAVVFEARNPSLFEALNLPALAYAGDPDAGTYKMPLLAAEKLLNEPTIRLSDDLRAAIKKATAPLRPLRTGDNFPWKLYGFQAKDAARGKRILETTGGVLLAGDMGSGKALSADMPVLTPTGWTPIGALTPGDQVMGRDGLPHPVNGVYPQGLRPLFDVEFSDGSTVTCDDEHLWFVQSPLARLGGRHGTVLPLHTLRAHLHTAAGDPLWYVPVADTMQYTPAGPPPADPYTVGCGATEHLPQPYLFGAVPDRIALLQGVLDRHAELEEHTHRPATVVATVPARQLADDLKALAESLSGTGHITAADTLMGAWRVAICLPETIPPFRNPAAAREYASTSTRRPHRAIVAVRPAGTGEAVCISVDAPAKLYITASTIPTHNTTMSLALVDDLNVWPLLVVAPLSAFSTWDRQLGQMGKKFYLATETPSKAWRELDAGGHDAVVITFDRLGAFAEIIEQYGFTGIIADEIQRIRTAGSRRSRALRALAGAVSYRIGLSGTPLTNTINDLLPVGAFLVPGEWRPRANEKDLDDLYPGDPVEAVADHLGTMMVRRRMEDTGAKLPKRNDHRVMVHLTPEQRKALADLEAEAEAAKEAGEFNEPNGKMHAFARLNRQRQIINCPAAAGLVGPNPKVTGAVNLANDFIRQGRKGVIFCVDRIAYLEIGRELDGRGIKWVGIWGATPPAQRIENERQFHSDPETKVVLCSLGAGSESWSASPSATFLICTAMCYSPATLSQMEARVYRLNSDLNGPPIEIIYMHAQVPGGSLDDRMVEILEIKRQLFAQVVDRRAHVDKTKISYSLGDLVYLMTGKRDATLDKREADTQAEVGRAQDRKDHAKKTLYAKKWKNKESEDAFYDDGGNAITLEEYLDTNTGNEAALAGFIDLVDLDASGEGEDFDVEDGDDEAAA